MPTPSPTNPRSRDKSGRPTTHGTGPRTKAWREQQLGQVSRRLLTIVSRPGGATATEALREMPRGMCNDAAERLSTLHDRGHIVRRMDGRHWRYFIGREAAEAWLRGLVQEEKPAAPEYFQPQESFGAEWARLRGGATK